jgi:hypothetical protein
LDKSTSITNKPGEVLDEAASRDDEDEFEETNAAESIVWTALLASLFGVMICPLLGHLYSLWLLCGLSKRPEPLRGHYKVMYWFALVLDVVIVLFVVAIAVTGSWN